MLILLEDKAQKINMHNAKHEYWERSGIPIVRVPLPVGDYVLMNQAIYKMLKGRDDVEKKDFLGLHSRSVDTKFSMDEVYSCMVQDHERFAKEADKAVENGIDLIILVEQRGIRNVDDVKNWQNQRFRKWKKDKWFGRKVNPRPPMSSESLMKAMKTFSIDHGCRWEFCSPEDAGRRVIELLTEDKNGKI